MDTRRSYLFVTWEGGGNVPAVLGVARRLAARGHRVRVLTEPCLEESVRRFGAGFIAFTRHFTRRDRHEPLLDDFGARTPVAALKRSFERVLFGPARIVAEETHRAIMAEPTDAVVADHLMLGALVAAEAAGVPRVVLFHTPEYLPGPGKPAAGAGFLPRDDLFGRVRDGLFGAVFLHTIGGYLQAFNDARQALGLPPLRSGREVVDQYHLADMRLIQTSASFDFPITPLPANARYVGPILDDPDWTANDAAPGRTQGHMPGHMPSPAPEPAPQSAPWPEPWPAARPRTDDRPLVVASLSSTFQNQRAALERIIRALGTLDVRGLVTHGPALDGAFHDLPANVQVVRAAPHASVFPHASAVITHAGHGTVMRALAHDLPVLCLPMGRDQDDNAARVVARGAGLRLKPTASSERIAVALRRLLREPTFAAGAKRLGRVIRDDATADHAVHALEALGTGAAARAA